MECKRCNGWMMLERSGGHSDDRLSLQPGWRCLNCGDVVDSVIMENRTPQAGPPVTVAYRPGSPTTSARSD